MGKIIASLTGVLLSLIILSFLNKKESNETIKEQPIVFALPPFLEEKIHNEFEEMKLDKIEFIEVPQIRDSNVGSDVLDDLESRMPPNHIYRDVDRITWAHETTHGLNSRLRQKYDEDRYEYHMVVLDEKLVYQSRSGYNAFYVLEGKSVILKEPDITISDVAKRIPQNLRGNVYNLYLIRSQSDWNNSPLYLYDEWVAYSNGSACRSDLRIRDRIETVRYMFEFLVYCNYVCIVSDTHDVRLLRFNKWQIERSLKLLKDNNFDFKILDLSNFYKDEFYKIAFYWNQTSNEPEIRDFWLNRYGQDWVDSLSIAD